MLQLFLPPSLDSTRVPVSFPQMSQKLLAKHISSIKPGRAVPKGSAPAAAWRLCAQPISEAGGYGELLWAGRTVGGL